jgi:hypothetical protein
MSQTKKDRSFPLKPQAISDEELAKIVAAALRDDFGKSASAVKQIGRLTGANLRAIKNWFHAKNAPSAGHLMLLAKSSPSLLKFVLLQIGGHDLWDAFQLLSPREKSEKTEISSSIYRDKNVPINLSKVRMNERQRWFLVNLQIKKTLNAEDIANHFGVADRTAKRDIEGLTEKGAIEFKGSKKTGTYQLIH